MDCTMGNDKDKPCLPAPLEGHGEFALTSTFSGASECRRITNNRNRTGDDRVAPEFTSSPQANFSRNSQALGDASFTNVQSNVFKFPQPPEMLYPDVNKSESSEVIDYNETCADYAMDDYQNLPVDMNLSPIWGSGVTDLPMRGHVIQAKRSKIDQSQISGTFQNLGMLQSVEKNNDANGSDAKMGFSGRIDGSFLTLGMGGGTEIGLKRDNLSTQEKANKLGKIVSSQENSPGIQQSTGNFSSVINLDSGTSSFMTNAGGLSSSTGQFGGLSFGCDNIGATNSAGNRLNAMAYYSSQPLQSDRQPNFLAKNSTATGIIGQTVAEFSNSDVHQSSMGNGAASLSTISISIPEHNRLSSLASESSRTTWGSSQPTLYELQNSYAAGTRMESPHSFMDYHPLRNQGSTTRQAPSGQLIPLPEASTIPVVGFSPFARCAQPVWPQPSIQGFGNNMFSLRGSPSSPDFGLFPKRLGIQPSDSAASQVAEGNLNQTLNSGAAQYTQRSVGPFGIGPSQVHLPVLYGPHRISSRPGNPNLLISRPAQHSQGPFRPPCVIGNLNLTNLRLAQNTQRPLGPDFASGRPQVLLPTQSHPHRLTPPTGQRIPVPIADGQSLANLKRPANEHPSVAMLNQRRKIMTQLATQHPASLHQQQRAVAPTRAPSPASSSNPAPPLVHIKRQGADQQLKPSGHKCLVCKRDVSFSPEGPIEQPAMPPVTAVLPCGHTFHDLCLQRITPEDQAKDPPCIPCALGES